MLYFFPYLGTFVTLIYENNIDIMKRKVCWVLTLLWVFVALTGAQEKGIKLIHGPYLQNVGPDEATIVWVADKPSVGWVELAPEGTESFYAVERPRFYDTENGVKKTSTVHSVKLKGLQPDTRYRYRVFAQEVLSHIGHKIVYGYFASTDVYTKKPLTFKTLSPKKSTVSFAMVNDIHGDSDLLQTLIGKCNLKQTDLFFFNGDMVSVSHNEAQVFEGFMDRATSLFAAEIPMYYARGNHETRGAFATEFQRYFSPKEKNLYFAFRQGPVYFILLDTGEDKPDSDIEYAGITVYDDYRTEQAAWLKDILSSKEYKEAPYKVVVAHIPPIGDWHGIEEVKNKFMPLLREAGPDLMLCGHLHRLVHDKATAQTPFPILVNPNKAVVQVEAGPENMNVKVVDVEGKMLDSFVVKRR